MTVRRWWDMKASTDDQAKVLRRLNLGEGLAGIPWAFLPVDAQTLLIRRVRITLPESIEADDSGS